MCPSWSCPTARAWVGPRTSRCPGSGSFLSFELPDGQHALLGDRRLEPGHAAAVELGRMVDRSGREPAAPRQSDLADGRE